MAVSDVRDILRRALFEPDFNALLLADPGQALVPYALSSAERSVLLEPGPMLYAFAFPSIDPPLPEELIRAMPPPPPPPPPPQPTTQTVQTIIIVIAIIAIIAFTLASVAQPSTLREEIEARLRPLVPKIGASEGAERSALIQQFVNELTREL